EVVDRAVLAPLQSGTALLYKRGCLDLIQQLPDLAALPHDLGRLLNHLGDGALAARFGGVSLHCHAIGANDHDLGAAVGLGLPLLSHLSSLSMLAQRRITGAGMRDRY